MVRLADLPATKREGMERYQTPNFCEPALGQRVALKSANDCINLNRWVNSPRRPASYAA